MSPWLTSWGSEKEPKGHTQVLSLPRGVEGVTRTQATMVERAVNRQEGVCPQCCWPDCLDLVLEAGDTRWLAYSAYFLSTVTLGTLAIPWCWRCGSGGSSPTGPNRALGQLTSGDSGNSRNLPEEHSPGSRRDLCPVVWWLLVMSGRCSRHGVPYLHSTDFLDCYHQGHEQLGHMNSDPLLPMWEPGLRKGKLLALGHTALVQP